MQPVKLTTAQLWLVHTLETIGSGAIVAGAITVYGAVSTGNYDYKVVGGLVLTAILAVLTKGWSGTIQGNANFLQAILDTGNDVKAIVSQPATIAPQQPAGPLVVQHITQLPESANVTPQPSVRQLNTVPPRPIVQPPIQMPQSLPAVDVAALNTQQVQAVPQVPFDRNFSGVIPAIQG